MLHRLIGLNSVISVGLSVLGMRKILVWFRRGSIAPFVKNSFNVSRTASAVMPQYFWKIGSSFRPDRELCLGLYQILCSELIIWWNFVRASFMAGVTFSVMYWSESSKSKGFDEVNRVWKYHVATCSRSSSVSAHVPFVLRSFKTRFLALLYLVVAWKKIVLRSPSRSQFSRLFYIQ